MDCIVGCRRTGKLESYVAHEVGYPSQKEELLMPYIEDLTEPTAQAVTVCAKVGK